MDTIVQHHPESFAFLGQKRWEQVRPHFDIVYEYKYRCVCGLEYVLSVRSWSSLGLEPRDFARIEGRWDLWRHMMCYRTARGYTEDVAAHNPIIGLRTRRMI
jgi:hypothetical protein